MKSFSGVVLVGALLGGAGMAALVLAPVGVRLDAERSEWSLVPVVVAAVDLATGEPVAMKDLTQRSVPQQFRTVDMVTPGEVNAVVGQRPTSPLQAGDPLLWSNFAQLDEAEAAADCGRALKPEVDAAAEKAGEQALAAIGPPLAEPAEPEPFSEPKPDATGAVAIVVAAEKVAAGTVLEVKHLTTASWPSHLVTASCVPPQHLNQLVGLRIDVPLEQGDAIWWQMLDDTTAPATLAGCRARAAEAIHRSKLETASRLAKGWTQAAAPRNEVKP